MLAWEVTTDDVAVVVACHGLQLSDEECAALHDELDHDAIVDGALSYLTMDEQVAAAYSVIEDQLMEAQRLPAANKLFEVPEW